MMAQLQDKFKRYEKKYLLNTIQYERLNDFLADKMMPDKFGRSTICNIYYDTSDYRLIRASIEKPVYKEKLRLRSYGVPNENDTVFVELKKKFKGIVYKRRVPMTLREAKDYLQEGNHPEGSSQILKEIDWFMDFYRPVPAAFIAYDRIALFGVEEEDLRITFDTSVRYRESMLDLAKGDWGYALTGQDQFLMEIKMPDSMPLWLSRGLSDLAIVPASFSKYGTCYQTHLQNLNLTKGGMICA